MSNDESITNDEVQSVDSALLRMSALLYAPRFDLRHSFVIRHSGFVINIISTRIPPGNTTLPTLRPGGSAH